MEMQINDLVSAIKKEGIEKAQLQAEQIIAEAKEKASAIILEAQNTADDIVKKAQEKLKTLLVLDLMIPAG